MNLALSSCAVMGDSGVGKTSLIEAITPNANNDLRRYTKKWEMKFSFYDIALIGEEHDRIRPLTYNLCDVIVILFSVVDSSSFQSAKTRWHPEVLRNVPPGIPIILVGNKKDLRDESTGATIVTEEQGKALAAEIKARHYLECSTLTKEGLDTFVDLVFTYINKPYAGEDESCCFVC